jgi:hypothetical protein
MSTIKWMAYKTSLQSSIVRKVAYMSRRILCCWIPRHVLFLGTAMSAAERDENKQNLSPRNLCLIELPEYNLSM